MAFTGVASSPQFDRYRNAIITITGAGTNAEITPPIRSLGYVIGSWQLTGITGTGAVCVLTGCNDPVNGPFGNGFDSITPGEPNYNVDGIYPLIPPNGMVPLFYGWVFVGGISVTSVTITVALMSSFG